MSHEHLIKMNIVLDQPKPIFKNIILKQKLYRYGTIITNFFKSKMDGQNKFYSHSNNKFFNSLKTLGAGLFIKQQMGLAVLVEAVKLLTPLDLANCTHQVGNSARDLVLKHKHSSTITSKHTHIKQEGHLKGRISIKFIINQYIIYSQVYKSVS